MDDKFILNTAVDYADVDRDEYLLLSGVFKHLQEVAIVHANQYDTGTRVMGSRGESWVLNRIDVAIRRYPRYEDALRIETWSSGVNGFRGYREFRVFSRDELIVSGSSLWLYVNLATKTLVRVPDEVATGFPTLTEPVHQSALERMSAPAPEKPVHLLPVTLRYADVDANGHVNNTAYFEYLQTALARSQLPARPSSVQVKFAKEIPPDTASVEVALEPRDGGVVFGIRSDGVVHAQGWVR
ncbi:hypothetical protein DB347_16710 [Opitutaceae bacterium EW11]|nr:hypothetical protein DB347_16710 [Opitutaceae bacterium EW11]